MKSTIDLESLEIFRAVVDAGSFTAAGGVLNKDKAHVSRVVSRLEKRLGVQLLKRSTRRLNITEIGRDFYERACGILAALEETEASIAHAQGEPRGVLRVTAGAEFGPMRVNYWIAEYLKRYPEVRVEADFSDRIVDVIHEGIDVAIRVGPLVDSELSVRPLGEIRYGLYASPAYAHTRGEPKSLKALAQHSLIMFAPRGKPVWPMVRGKEREDVTLEALCVINNNLAARELAADGLGIALLPHFQAAPQLAQKRLTRVLEDWERVPVSVSALFTSSRYMTPKVRAFVDLAIVDFKNSDSNLQ
ncbi:LysR family transcriptional regulator [Acaryochloris marina]|uniref:LysR family transcriptional regulator n=1 Tax=Acaryochloris marina TaxID=155978 RepID=UPI0021C3DA60|nr:LysR family transcriptional regulator [Acaryochloris marina]BDM83632.1 LysR family transcriptional regulator [Acaryochloris marina MBIC10699]